MKSRNHQSRWHSSNYVPSIDLERDRAQEAREGGRIIRKWGIDCTREGLYLATLQARTDRTRGNMINGISRTGDRAIAD